MNVNVAIPYLEDRVTPCFEAASNFLIISVEDNHEIGRKSVRCEGDEGLRRIRLLRLHDINVLICNGIKGFYRDLLTSMGLMVISEVSSGVDAALEAYMSGKLKPATVKMGIPTGLKRCELGEMIDWAKDHFESNGYQIKRGPGPDSFLIDLVAEISCPVCGKPVKVAICCGAHTYRTDQEIQEFNFCAKSNYNSRVFVFPGDDTMAQQCREYGIELIRPFEESEYTKKKLTDKIPVLKFPVEGHEAASAGIE